MLEDYNVVMLYVRFHVSHDKKGGGEGSGSVSAKKRGGVSSVKLKS